MIKVSLKYLYDFCFLNILYEYNKHIDASNTKHMSTVSTDSKCRLLCCYYLLCCCYCVLYYFIIWFCATFVV